MKILHVITGLQKSAGTSTFCGEVCNQLVSLGHDVTLAILYPDQKNLYPLDSRVHLVSIESILHSTPTPNLYTVIHIHGLWSMVLHRISTWARAHDIPVVWSTHGMTAPWSMRHKCWKKFPAWWLYQKWDLRRAAAIHCTTELEQKWNLAMGFKRCFIAPLGTRLPARVEVESRSRTVEGKILLFVGRIYPVKALDRLIEAFARVDKSVRRNWTLRLVGPDQAGHMVELMALCDRLGISYSTPEEESTIRCATTTSDYDSTIQFVGSKFGLDLEAEYANCDCLALVSHTENFGATVVDAMAHGKPVITSTKTPWKIVADNKCGWWVDNDVEPLSSAIADMMIKADDGGGSAQSILQQMGERGRALVEEHYTWSAVCDKLVQGYMEIMR